MRLRTGEQLAQLVVADFYRQSLRWCARSCSSHEQLITGNGDREHSIPERAAASPSELARGIYEPSEKLAGSRVCKSRGVARKVQFHREPLEHRRCDCSFNFGRSSSSSSLIAPRRLCFRLPAAAESAISAGALIWPDARARNCDCPCSARAAN